MKKIDWMSLLLNIFLPLVLVGGLSQYLTAPNISNVYNTLERPPLSPPNWVFMIVWPILYILMGISAYIIGQSKPHKRGSPLDLYYAQLMLNFLWSIVFFNIQSLPWSVIIILTLIVLVFATYKKFKEINSTAASLLIPYLLWLLFAAYLNIGFWVLN